MKLVSCCSSNADQNKQVYEHAEHVFLHLLSLDNVDEMLLQFSGREDELIESLRIMQERSITKNE